MNADPQSKQNTVVKRITVAVVTLLLTCSLGLAPANAHAGAHSSRGDAEAVLHAYPSGGTAISVHAPHVAAGPSQADPPVSIRPFSIFSGTHFCAEDWHAIALAVFAFEGVLFFDEPDVVTREDVQIFLDALDWEILLDGQPVEGLTQSPLQPYSAGPQFLELVETDLEAFYGVDVTVTRVWAVQRGRVIAPGELSLGVHTLSATVTQAGSDFVLEDGMTFFVDPPESGACSAISL